MFQALIWKILFGIIAICRLGSQVCGEIRQCNVRNSVFFSPEIFSVWNCWIVVDLADLIRLYLGKSYKLGYKPIINIHVCTVD